MLCLCLFAGSTRGAFSVTGNGILLDPCCEGGIDLSALAHRLSTRLLFSSWDSGIFFHAIRRTLDVWKKFLRCVMFRQIYFSMYKKSKLCCFYDLEWLIDWLLQQSNSIIFFYHWTYCYLFFDWLLDSCFSSCKCLLCHLIDCLIYDKCMKSHDCFCRLIAWCLIVRLQKTSRLGVWGLLLCAVLCGCVICIICRGMWWGFSLKVTRLGLFFFQAAAPEFTLIARVDRVGNAIVAFFPFPLPAAADCSRLHFKATQSTVKSSPCAANAFIHQEEEGRCRRERGDAFVCQKCDHQTALLIALQLLRMPLDGRCELERGSVMA